MPKVVMPPVVQVAQVRVRVPPSESAPPPPRGAEVFTVTDELASIAFVTAAFAIENVPDVPPTRFPSVPE